MEKWKRHKLKDQKWLRFHMRLVARAMWSNPGIILSRAKQTMESWASKTKSTAPAAQPPLPINQSIWIRSGLTDQQYFSRSIRDTLIERGITVLTLNGPNDADDLEKIRKTRSEERRVGK